MNEKKIRNGSLDNAEECADIVNSWINKTDWLPRNFTKYELLTMIREAIPQREFWVIGEPISGYISFNKKESQVIALYTRNPGSGDGKLLLDAIKERKKYIELWSHTKNTKAHRFYLREGFKILDQKKSGLDGIPETLFVWQRNKEW